MSAADAAQNPEPQAADEAYWLLFEQSREMVCIVDLAGRFTSVNRAGEKLTGYSAADLVGRPAVELIAPELREQATRQFRERLRGDPAPSETVFITRHGRQVPVLATSALISRDGRPVGVLGLITDLTVRTSAERALSAQVETELHLRDAEARARSFFESAPIGEAIVGTDGQFLEVNSALCAIVGYSEDELPAMTFQDITHPDDLDADLEFVRQMLTGEIRTYQMEKRYLHKHGHIVWTFLSVSLVTSSSGDPSYFISQIQDISERKAAEEELRQAESRYRTLVEQLPLGMYIRPVDMSLPDLYASPQLETMLGYPPEEWQSSPDLLARVVHPDDQERARAAAAVVRDTGKPSRDEYRFIARDGRVVWVQDETFRVLDEHGTPCVQGFLLDITERKRAEAERDRLQQDLHGAQKLEAIGRLAGGVAHDFNNMLTAIKGYNELLLAGLEPGTQLHHEAEQIRRAAEQASSLPQQLLAFARRQPLEAKLVDVNTLVATASALLRHLIGERIELTTIPAPHPAFAQVDPDRIEQMLVNLALNARDAMPTGGSLTIATSITEITNESTADGDVAAGSYVVISVADDGQGMDAEARERAFEPFFTTKPPGKGSGLGLASVHGTVSQSGGFVRVESQPGRGTTFHLCFPSVEAAPVEEAEPLGERAPVVLLAEDEGLVREFVSSVLEREGFEVHAAANGLEALEQLERLDRPIDLLVTDLVMPRMSGRELAERVAERQPRAPTVFISGYSEEQPTLERDALRESAFVRKPFSPSVLVQTVNSLIARHRSASGPATPAVAADLVTCVIADDHPAVLDSVSRSLELAGMRVLARVSRADEALREIEAHRPLTALVDITMEPFSGIEVARQAAVSSPQTAVVLYTGHHDHALLREALEAGARGFVLKETPLSELVKALGTVAAGGTYVDARLAGALASAATTAQLPTLTKRERQVLGLLSSGMTNEKAAKELGISAETVQSHVRNTMTKLDADTRTQAVATAIRQALIL